MSYTKSGTDPLFVSLNDPETGFPSLLSEFDRSTLIIFLLNSCLDHEPSHRQSGIWGQKYSCKLFQIIIMKSTMHF